MDIGEDFAFEEAIELLTEYSWLVEFRIVDFLTSGFWNTCHSIPKEWRSFVANDLSETDYATVLMDMASVEALDISAKIDHFRHQCYSCSFVTKHPFQPRPDTEKRRNVKLKKTYEIEQLSDQILQLLNHSGLSLAVDIGAGQGYLALELLARDEAVNVIALESADIQVHGTSKRLEDLSSDTKSRLLVKQVHLEADHPGQFDELLFENGPRQEYLMYSLHACGSLSECMLQTFCHSECKASCLFNVACCYNLIDETLPGKHFPLSHKFMSIWAIRGLRLTRNMKMVACQAPFRWKHRPQQTRNFFRRHFYRALLELLVVTIDPDQCQPLLNRLGNINDSHLTSFSAYARAAFSSMGLDDFDPILADNLLQTHRCMEKTIAFLWTMRALLGPCVEALILYDRYCYLGEVMPRAQVRLVPVLDPLKSPRNIALIAEKNKVHK